MKKLKFVIFSTLLFAFSLLATSCIFLDCNGYDPYDPYCCCDFTVHPKFEIFIMSQGTGGGRIAFDEGDILNLPDPTREGFTFLEWRYGSRANETENWRVFDMTRPLTANDHNIDIIAYWRSNVIVPKAQNIRLISGERIAFDTASFVHRGFYTIYDANGDIVVERSETFNHFQGSGMASLRPRWDLAMGTYGVLFSSGTFTISITLQVDRTTSVVANLSEPALFEFNVVRDTALPSPDNLRIRRTVGLNVLHEAYFDFVAGASAYYIQVINQHNQVSYSRQINNSVFVANDAIRNLPQVAGTINFAVSSIGGDGAWHAVNDYTLGFATQDSVSPNFFEFDVTKQDFALPAVQLEPSGTINLTNPHMGYIVRDERNTGSGALQNMPRGSFRILDNNGNEVFTHFADWGLSPNSFNTLPAGSYTLRARLAAREIHGGGLWAFYDNAFLFLSDGYDETEFEFFIERQNLLTPHNFRIKDNAIHWDTCDNMRHMNAVFRNHEGAIVFRPWSWLTATHFGFSQLPAALFPDGVFSIEVSVSSRHTGVGANTIRFYDGSEYSQRFYFYLDRITGELQYIEH